MGDGMEDGMGDESDNERDEETNDGMGDEVDDEESRDAQLQRELDELDDMDDFDDGEGLLEVGGYGDDVWQGGFYLQCHGTKKDSLYPEVKRDDDREFCKKYLKDVLPLNGGLGYACNKAAGKFCAQY